MMGDQSSLYAVLFADLENYSGLVSQDEPGTLAFMERCFALAQSEGASAAGQLIKKTGDGFVMLFRSATSAIEFSLAMHSKLAEADETGTRRLRIGIHLGEVRRDHDDIHGHSVNKIGRAHV